MDEITLQTAARLLPPRAHDAHKGSFGHTLVIAGSRNYAGAARLAAEGALRSGTGLVTLAVPRCIQDVVAIGLPEAITAGLSCSDQGSFRGEAATEAARLAPGKNALVCGPGLTTDDGAARFVDALVQLCGDVPLLLDADALNNLAASGDDAIDRLPASKREHIVTPHPGEAARLLASTTADVQRDREAAARQLAARTGAVAVLKGHRTLVCAPDGRLAVNTSGSHGLAKGGSGDVLAGLIGGLLAQGLNAFDAARLGVFVHGLAGEIAEARYGARAMLARDLLDALGEAWKRLESAT